MSSRRPVRVTAGFFDQLDSQLGEDRGPHGEPSATDFIAFQLPEIIERFAEDFDDLPEAVEGVAAARMLLTPGVLVYATIIYGVLANDGVVDLVGISIDSGSASGDS